MRHQEDKLSKAISSLFPIKMIAILEWTQSNAQQNIEQLQTPTMGVTINKKSTTTLLKKPYKARFIANSSSCTTTELHNCKPRVLQLLKNMLSNIVKRYMRDPVKTYFGLLKIQVKF